jgi:hypothetical protein
MLSRLTEESIQGHRVQRDRLSVVAEQVGVPLPAANTRDQHEIDLLEAMLVIAEAQSGATSPRGRATSETQRARELRARIDAMSADEVRAALARGPDVTLAEMGTPPSPHAAPASNAASDQARQEALGLEVARRIKAMNSCGVAPHGER